MHYPNELTVIADVTCEDIGCISDRAQITGVILTREVVPLA